MTDTVLRVWAPDHDRVDVDLGDRVVPMDPDGGGWWRAEVPGAGAGLRYRYRLDGGPPRPDPRSGWQPEGIDGPSAVVDHAAFAWTDGGWRGAHLPACVVYELHVGTFTEEGTFDAAIGRLDHLVDLGVGAVEVLPVAEFSGTRGWGYDGVLTYAPHHAYGGPDGFKRLVDACHARGLAVVLDVVYNHLGPAGNYLHEFGPYFTDRYKTPWGAAVNFDGAGSDEVRRWVTDNARMWLDDYHVDGLRLDAVHAIYDESALHLLEELAGVARGVADRTGRTNFLIAESDRNDPRLVRPPEAGGYGLDATWCDDFHHAVHGLLTGERSGYYEDFGTFADLALALERVYVYGRRFSPHRNRSHGRPVGDLPATRFVVCAQNHDQIGNRAAGERLAALVSPGRLRIAAAVLLLGPSVPMLFQGEEWGASTPWQYFTAHEDPELGQAVSEGRQREFSAFGWAPEDVPDPQELSTWQRSVLDWSEPEEGDHASLLEWHRSLIDLRRSRTELVDGRLDRVHVAYSEDDGWLRMERGSLVVVFGLASEPQAVDVGEGRRVLLGSEGGLVVDGGRIVLPPDSVAVLDAAPADPGDVLAWPTAP